MDEKQLPVLDHPHPALSQKGEGFNGEVIFRPFLTWSRQAEAVPLCGNAHCERHVAGVSLVDDWQRTKSLHCSVPNKVVLLLRSANGKKKGTFYFLVISTKILSQYILTCSWPSVKIHAGSAGIRRVGSGRGINWGRGEAVGMSEALASGLPELGRREAGAGEGWFTRAPQSPQNFCPRGTNARHCEQTMPSVQETRPEEGSSAKEDRPSVRALGRISSRAAKRAFENSSAVA